MAKFNYVGTKSTSEIEFPFLHERVDKIYSDKQTAFYAELTFWQRIRAKIGARIVEWFFIGFHISAKSSARHLASIKEIPIIDGGNKLYDKKSIQSLNI